MASDETKQGGLWSQPGFVASGVAVVLLGVFGVVLAIHTATSDDPSDPSPTASAASTTQSSTSTTPSPRASSSSEASVCGLRGVIMRGSLPGRPAAQWAYQGTTAYPTYPDFGPGRTSSENVRFCFRHSPAGALFAAANALVQSSDPKTSRAWLRHFLTKDADVEEFLPLAATTSDAQAATRMEIAGFRLLSYDGHNATIDLAFRGTGSGKTVYGSIVYPLRWEEGDWKLAVTSPQEFSNVTQLPDLAGYIAWGA
jgi:hypothetical protein